MVLRGRQCLRLGVRPADRRAHPRGRRGAAVPRRRGERDGDERERPLRGVLERRFREPHATRAELHRRQRGAARSLRPRPADQHHAPGQPPVHRPEEGLADWRRNHDRREPARVQRRRHDPAVCRRVRAAGPQREHRAQPVRLPMERGQHRPGLGEDGRVDRPGRGHRRRRWQARRGQLLDHRRRQRSPRSRRRRRKGS